MMMATFFSSSHMPFQLSHIPVPFMYYYAASGCQVAVESYCASVLRTCVQSYTAGERLKIVIRYCTGHGKHYIETGMRDKS